MKRKKMWMLGAFLAVFLVWAWRVWKVNDAYAEIPEETIQAGEWADLDGCMMDTDSDMDGYGLLVIGKSFVDTDDFLEEFASEQEREEYQASVERLAFWKPDQVCVVHVKLRNQSEEESVERGINWVYMYLFDKNLVLDFDRNLYAFANRAADGSPVLSLKPGTEMDFYLPYGVYLDALGNKAGQVETIPFRMVVSLYPTMKLMELGG